MRDTPCCEFPQQFRRDPNRRTVAPPTSRRIRRRGASDVLIKIRDWLAAFLTDQRP
jgi:hypothetical protein